MGSSFSILNPGHRLQKVKHYLIIQNYFVSQQVFLCGSSLNLKPFTDVPSVTNIL
jgi:hypothetical protein